MSGQEQEKRLFTTVGSDRVRCNRSCAGTAVPCFQVIEQEGKAVTICVAPNAPTTSTPDKQSRICVTN